MTTIEEPRDTFTTMDAVAGLMAAASVTLSGVAMHAGFFLGIEAHPARTAPIAMILAIVAGRMSTRFEAMARKAMFFSVLAWVVGMTIAVLTEKPLL